MLNLVAKSTVFADSIREICVTFPRLRTGGRDGRTVGVGMSIFPEFW